MRKKQQQEERRGEEEPVNTYCITATCSDLHVHYNLIKCTHYEYYLVYELKMSQALQCLCLHFL